MDIYELRQKTIVTLFGSFWNDNNYGVIHYSVNGKPNVLKLQPHELGKELIAIGSIEEDMPHEKFYNYHISQWDALNIAIRHEQAKAMDKEIDNSDIGKAIKNITNGQGDTY